MKQPELVYWKGSGDVRSDLLQAIRVVGYELTIISDIEDVLKRPTAQYPGLIVVDASAGEAEASQRVIEMSASGPLSHIPIIFLSYQATRRSAVLKKTFSKFLPVDIPFRLQALLEKLLELCPVQRSEGAEPEVVAAPVKVEERSPQVSVSVSTAKVRIREGDPANLKVTHGGEFFALAEKANRINDTLLIPEHPKKAEIVRALNFLSIKNELFGLRARRVSFLASAIANSVGLGAEADRHIRVAGMFLNWGLRDSSTRYLKHDFLLLDNTKISPLVSAAFNNSAKYVREKLSDGGAATIIEQVARILVSNSDEPFDPQFMNAYCALASELADRGCWSGDFWDPFGAHRSVRKLEDGTIFKVSPNISQTLSRMLSEASATRLLLDTLPELPTEAGESHDLRMMQEARLEAEVMFGDAEQKSVNLADLKPGMRLSEPIIGVDGKLILRSNINLTEDLIKNLWRLTTIRPVRPKVSILLDASV